MSSLTKREDLEGVERVVSDVLDEYNMRKHGILSSHSGYDTFLSLLADEGYTVVKIGDVPPWMSQITPEGSSVTILDGDTSEFIGESWASPLYVCGTTDDEGDGFE